MIKNSESLSMAETMEYIKEDKEVEIEVKKFLKKFVKLKSEEAKEMRKKLEALDLLKLKADHISKIIDIMPEDDESLNKIFTDVGLNEDETKKIFDIIEESK